MRCRWGKVCRFSGAVPRKSHPQESRMRAPRVVVVVLLSGSPVLAQTAFVNWETPPVHPVEMTPDETTLLVTNTADARLEIFTLGGALPVWTASVPVGLEPVSVRARSNTEAWVANKISDTVSIVSLVSS